MKTIQEVLPGFMKRCLDGLEPTSTIGPISTEFCVFCGQEKMAFYDPRDGGGVSILECECERHLAMLNDFLRVNHEWIDDPHRLGKAVSDYNSDAERERHAEFVIKAERAVDAMMLRRADFAARAIESRRLGERS